MRILYIFAILLFFSSLMGFRSDDQNEFEVYVQKLPSVELSRDELKTAFVLECFFLDDDNTNVEFRLNRIVKGENLQNNNRLKISFAEVFNKSPYFTTKFDLNQQIHEVKKEIKMAKKFISGDFQKQTTYAFIFVFEKNVLKLHKIIPLSAETPDAEKIRMQYKSGRRTPAEK